jgi:WD40 repeat protein
MTYALSQDDSWIHELVEDELSFNDAVGVLCNHGLVVANASSEELFESRGYSMLFAVAFLPDGKVLASGSGDNTVKHGMSTRGLSSKSLVAIRVTSMP